MAERKINDAEKFVFQEEIKWLKKKREMTMQIFIEDVRIINNNIEKIERIINSGVIEE